MSIGENNKILVFNNAKGGVATAWMLKDMMSRGVSPRALLCNRVNPIIAQGAAFADMAICDRFEKGDVTFNKVEDQLGPNYFSKVASFKMNQEEIISEKRTYLASGQKTTEAGIKVRLLEDYYIS